MSYIPYETEDGVVVAVDLDGTVHRAKPPITDAQVEAAGMVLYENWSEWDRDEPYAKGHIQLVRDALEAAREAGR
jgi:hypothetical protein